MKSSETGPWRITIDDLGLYRGVETGVLELASLGVPLHCSWLTNYLPPSREYLAQELCRSGLHFNVIEGPSALKSRELCDDRGNFRLHWLQFATASRPLRAAVEEEFEFQLTKARGWFGDVRHVDSHLHVHAIPWIHSLLDRKQREHGIAFLRNPFQPVQDDWTILWRPGALAKILLLRACATLNASAERPCYGISRPFRMDRGHALASLRNKQREILWHAARKESKLHLDQFRFVTEEQTDARALEWEELRGFLQSVVP